MIEVDLSLQTLLKYSSEYGTSVLLCNAYESCANYLLAVCRYSAFDHLRTTALYMYVDASS